MGSAGACFVRLAGGALGLVMVFVAAHPVPVGEADPGGLAGGFKSRVISSNSWL